MITTCFRKLSFFGVPTLELSVLDVGRRCDLGKIDARVSLHLSRHNVADLGNSKGRDISGTAALSAVSRIRWPETIGFMHRLPSRMGNMAFEASGGGCHTWPRDCSANHIVLTHPLALQELWGRQDPGQPKGNFEKGLVDDKTSTISSSPRSTSTRTSR